MAKLNDIVKFLNKELKVKSMKDEWSVNGLQVRGNPEVARSPLPSTRAWKSSRAQGR
jgi:putative NIF3 family GTP cyclohydrolase 1 type 2